MARASSELEGVADCVAAMHSLSKAVANNVGRKSLRTAAAIVSNAAATRAPVSDDPRDKTRGSLKASVKVVTHKGKKNSPSVAVLAADPAAVRTEYGRTNQQAKPWFRPAVDATEQATIKAFAEALKIEIERAAQRAAKRASKAK